MTLVVVAGAVTVLQFAAGRRHLCRPRRPPAPARRGGGPEHRRRAGRRAARGDRPGQAARHPRPPPVALPARRAAARDHRRHPRRRSPSVRPARSSRPGRGSTTQPPPLGRTALLTAAAIAGAALLIVGLGAAAALREPLSVQVSTRRRPRRATTLAIFLSLLVIVGAGVAAYRSRSADGEPDLVVLLGPALVGLALGQVAIWLIRIFARGFTPVTEKRGMSAFLATRRLARADDLVTPIRLVVAAAVVGALALTGATSVDRWTDSQARVESGGATGDRRRARCLRCAAAHRAPRPGGDPADGHRAHPQRGATQRASRLCRCQPLGRRRRRLLRRYDARARLELGDAPRLVACHRRWLPANRFDVDARPRLDRAPGRDLHQPRRPDRQVRPGPHRGARDLRRPRDNRAGSAGVELRLPRGGIPGEQERARPRLLPTAARSPR